MTELDAKALQEELDHYHAEREKIRALIGQIGGAVGTRTDRLFNVIFIVLVLGLFVLDIFRHVGFEAWPEGISLELAVLLVSAKIIWMIHRQAKVEHFQFWILNSIEFRLNELMRRFTAIEEVLTKVDDD
ncbi:MAG: hypothetical protein ACYTFO_08800 [Planctomycetota bacterium]|jgi:hypothetical protein